MRLTVSFLVLGIVGAVLIGCGDGGNNSAANVTATPTSTREPTVGDILIDDQAIPGCTKVNEGSLFEGAITQAFDCSDDGRLTNAVIFHKTVEDARRLQDNTWGTRDGATDQIRRTLQVRPVNLASLKVTEVTDSFGRVGAEQENVWCATFTDQSGTTNVTEFHGAFRYHQVVVSYTSISTDGVSCDGQSDARQYAQTYAREQFQKLKQHLP